MPTINSKSNHNKTKMDFEHPHSCFIQLGTIHKKAFCRIWQRISIAEAQLQQGAYQINAAAQVEIEDGLHPMSPPTIDDKGYEVSSTFDQSRSSLP